MVYIPHFMIDFVKFDKERKYLKTIKDWVAFSEKWFDRENWPQKSAEQRARESVEKRTWPYLAGREWSRTSFLYDISPEARYEYKRTIQEFGDPIVSPGIQKTVRLPENGWALSCPFCEISTEVFEIKFCPQCERPLFYSCFEVD